ncbi:MAG: hypothetical protein QOF83_1452 [Solirubrobacteraceae bacterium]|jgi:hypothetical protein|nr:hypothetical protein [Solirubrobacteraceae bacterium]
MRYTRVGVLVTALIAAGALTASQALAGKTKRHQKVVTVGIVLTRSGNSAVSLYKVHSSLYGQGAAIQHAKLKNSNFPIHGTDTVTTYYADGAAATKDTFTVGTLNASGIGAITGSGRCTGGTGIHKHQRCTYKLTGTYNAKTTISHVTATGTVTG